MNDLPKCPCCDEDGLRLVTYDLENGQLHYKAVCDCCGVEFHHEKFYGFNSVMKYFNDACGDLTCENISLTGSADNWLCSECGSKRKKQASEDGYSYCPDCGTKVLEW